MEEEVLGKAYDGRLMRRLLAYIRPYKLPVVAALVLLVAFLVLRPLMKSLTKGAPRLKAGSGEADDLDGDKLSISGQGGKAIKLAPSFEQQIAAARTLVGQDPRRAAQVVKDWVSADG